MWFEKSLLTLTTRFNERVIIITRLFVIREQYKEQYEVISISHTISM